MGETEMSAFPSSLTESTTSESTKDTAENEPSRLPQKWGLMVVVLLVLSAIVLGILVFSTEGPEAARRIASTTTSDDGDSQPAYYSKRRPRTPRASTPGTTSEEAETNLTASTEAEDVTEIEATKQDTTEVTEVTPKPLTQRSLLCTLGITQGDYAFPPDGICDFSFFDSLSIETAASLAAPFPPSFSSILEVARKHKRTEYGVGFDYHTLGRMEDVIKDPATKQHLDELHSRRLFHFGYLNVPFFNVAGRVFSRVMMVLKAVSSMMSNKRSPSRPIYTVVSVGINGSGWTSWLPHLFRDTFKPDGIISLGHFAASDRQLTGCRILPPTYMESPATYYHNLEQAHDGVQKVSENAKNIAYFVSVAMYGRWYKPREEGQHDFLKPCANYSGDIHGRIDEVCKNADFDIVYHKEEPQGMLAYNSKSGMVLTYDDRNSLCQKLCFAKRSRVTINYGIAAYNIEYSDARNKCDRGDFPRLRLLKDVAEYFASSYTSTSAHGGCTMLASSIGPSTPNSMT